MSEEKSLSWNVFIIQLLRRSKPTVLTYMAHIGIKSNGMKCSSEVKKVFFSIFKVSKRLRTSGIWTFLYFFKRNNSKTKMKREKNFLYFCRANNSSSIDISIDSVFWTVSELVYLPRTPYFRFSVNNTLSMKN